MPKTTATDILTAVTEFRGQMNEFRDLMTKFCTETTKQLKKLNDENTTLRKRVNGIGKLLQSLAASGHKSGGRTRAVSPPPGRQDERSRTTSNQSVISLASEDEESNQTHAELPCKPGRGEVWLTALTDGWLLHGNTFSLKDLIKAHGGKFCRPMKGWVFTEKAKVTRVVKRISVPVRTEKVKNTLEGVGYVPYKPEGNASEPKVLRDGHVVKENRAALDFLGGSESENEDNGGGRTTTRCLIEDSEDEKNDEDGNVSVSEDEDEE
jgi:hypothetical protein